ncbi:MAG TPA: cytochrome c [Macromonas sp.]|nr:cytochrome c [Macromonas sp.]
MNTLFPRFQKHDKTLLRSAMAAGVAACIALLAGCAVEVENRQAAVELKKETTPPGSVYTGWRVFQGKCAACHGPDATGTALAPDLTARLRDIGPRQFVGLVLQRYDWTRPSQPAANAPSMDGMVEEILQRQGAVIQMPAWNGEPQVNAHIMDLYAYLSARSEGTQGPGKPAQ